VPFQEIRPDAVGFGRFALWRRNAAGLIKFLRRIVTNFEFAGKIKLPFTQKFIHVRQKILQRRKIALLLVLREKPA
jgi:hypothetical protein